MDYVIEHFIIIIQIIFKVLKVMNAIEKKRLYEDLEKPVTSETSFTIKVKEKISQVWEIIR